MMGLGEEERERVRKEQKMFFFAKNILHQGV